jgi:hypothetical protein
VVELGAALGVSYRSAFGLVTDSLELCFRLPTLWGLVQGGRLQAWKARKVAQATRDLSAAAAGFVDRQAGIAGRRNRLPVNLAGLVTQALNRYDPETAEGLEEAALEARGVVFDYTGTQSLATARLSATLDLVDARDLDTTISDLAGCLGRLGDSSPVGVRRAHALGLLAHPQRVLDFFGEPAAGTGHEAGGSAGAAGATGSVVREWNATPATLYLHVTTDDLRAATTHDGTGDGTGEGNHGGTVEKLGAGTLSLLADWLRRAGKLTIRPVLDPYSAGPDRIEPARIGRVGPVDRHDPPEAMRETVVLRDGHCVFPGCTVDARSCDLDHIEPYVAMDDGGPPGQTNIENLACLCRRHHRLKTFTAWTYHRVRTHDPDDAPDGYMWTSPYGTVFHVGTDPKH